MYFFILSLFDCCSFQQLYGILSLNFNTLFEGDSMMYHNSMNGGVGANGNGNCSGGQTGGSPNSTPPNINACSSTTPPLSSGQTSQSDGNDMVRNLET